MKERSTIVYNVSSINFIYREGNLSTIIRPGEGVSSLARSKMAAALRTFNRIQRIEYIWSNRPSNV